MKSGAIKSDAYLNGWRKGSPIPFKEDLSDAINLLIKNLEKEFGDERLHDLVLSGGIAERE